jgi:hypothetical protein
VALERAHVARKQSEANRASAITVIDEVDERLQFLAPVIIGREQVRLMLTGGNQVEQHDADTKRLGARHALPDLLEAAEEKAGGPRPARRAGSPIRPALARARCSNGRRAAG